MARSAAEAVYAAPGPQYAESYSHPATFNPQILAVIADMVRRTGARYVLDPFAGTGKVHRLQREIPDLQTVGVELEAEWSNMSVYNVIGNALCLPPHWTLRFDALATSATFGNRMGDHFVDRQAAKGYRRNTYRHAIGRMLHPDNSGLLQWGTTHKTRLAYCRFHRQAWSEAYRVLRWGGYLILEMKDHIRQGKRQRVTLWHIECLKSIGFRLIQYERVLTSGNRMGRNGQSRIPYTSVMLFQKSMNL